MWSVPTHHSINSKTTGDDSRSFLATLSTVVQSGIQVLIWAGDADWICNWFGGQAVAESITYAGSATFKAKAVSSYTVNGVAGGTFKTVTNLSWLRVFGAGHEVPFYREFYLLSLMRDGEIERWNGEREKANDCGRTGACIAGV